MAVSAASSLTEQKLLKQQLDTAHAEAARPLSREEVAEIVQSILGSMDGDVNVTDLRLYKELVDLAKYIEDAKAEIAALQPTDIRDEHIPNATDELDAVVGATEKATFAIFDACDAIGAVSATLDPDAAGKLNEQVTKIYEACNFQDITGQRISKVVRTLKHIEAKVDMVVAVFGNEVRQNHARGATVPAPAPTASADEILLNGPQLPGNAMDQDEIDRLLASFD
jgi:chemotaxis protein CheZ